LKQIIFKTEKTAKVCVLEPNGEVVNSIVCLHGYGYLNDYFIRKFESIKKNGYRIVAPEGLSRFYLSGTQGRVGASWMTKDLRTHDIDDNIAYLSQVFSQPELTLEDEPIVLGFSQGVPTLMRFLWATKQTSKAVLVYASDIPKDVLTKEGVAFFNQFPIYLIVGTEDQFISEERLEQHVKFLNEVGLNYQLVRFEGKHNIHPETINKILKEIYEI